VDRFPETPVAYNEKLSPKAECHLEEEARQAHIDVALRDGKQKSDLPSLLRRGSKLASSSCERLEMSAMVTTISLKKWREGVYKRRRFRCFGGDGCLGNPPKLHR
jgi:hypothetical protein